MTEVNPPHPTEPHTLIPRLVLFNSFPHYITDIKSIVLTLMLLPVSTLEVKGQDTFLLVLYTETRGCFGKVE